MALKKKPKGFERYPLSTVLIANSVFLLNYVIGIYIFTTLWVPLGILYVAYVLYLEASVFREGCRYCYYYGKMCPVGKGALAPLFVRKGDPKKFCERTLSAKDFIPNMLVTILPTVGGAVLLYLSFSWIILILMAIPWISMFAGNPVIYGKLACPHCRQGMKCCPAMDYFMKKEKK